MGKKKVNAAKWVSDQWAAETLRDPKSTPDRMSILTLTPESIVGIFTPSRVALLHEIRGNKSRSIGEIASRLERPLESVSRDLKALSFYGLIEFERNGKMKVPRPAKQLILVPMQQ